MEKLVQWFGEIGATALVLTIYMGAAFGLAFLLNWHFKKYESKKGGK